jgi:hypothetical protein
MGLLGKSYNTSPRVRSVLVTGRELISVTVLIRLGRGMASDEAYPQAGLACHLGHQCCDSLTAR